MTEAPRDDTGAHGLSTAAKRYFYGAYATGAAWPALELFPAGMRPDEFELMSTDHLAMFDRVWEVATTERPVGLIAKRGGELHATWYTWATSRDILEGAARMLADFRREDWAIVIVGDHMKRYFNRLGDYGLLRRVGTFLDAPIGRSAVYEVKSHARRR